MHYAREEKGRFNGLTPWLSSLKSRLLYSVLIDSPRHSSFSSGIDSMNPLGLATSAHVGDQYQDRQIKNITRTQKDYICGRMFSVALPESSLQARVL
jgi:hypothetical protein